MWLQVTAIVLPQVQQELNPVRIEYTALALYVGLILGAYTWGILSDLIGRRLSFNVLCFVPFVTSILMRYHYRLRCSSPAFSELQPVERRTL